MGRTRRLFLGLGLVGITAILATRSDRLGADLWALVAASLLAAPIAWFGYFVLLAPGILLLLARGQTGLSLLLVSLTLLLQEWGALWSEGGANYVLAALMLTLPFYVLLAHWLAFLHAARTEARASGGPGNGTA